MDIIQTFYDTLADQYDKLFADWQATTREQAAILDGLFHSCGFDRGAWVLDCACGIGTQAIGLAALGYCVTGSDISEAELARARQRAAQNGAGIRWAAGLFPDVGLGGRSVPTGAVYHRRGGNAAGE